MFSLLQLCTRFRRYSTFLHARELFRRLCGHPKNFFQGGEKPYFSKKGKGKITKIAGGEQKYCCGKPQLAKRVLQCFSRIVVVGRIVPLPPTEIRVTSLGCKLRRCWFLRTRCELLPCLSGSLHVPSSLPFPFDHFIVEASRVGTAVPQPHCSYIAQENAVFAAGTSIFEVLLIYTYVCTSADSFCLTNGTGQS